MPPVLVRTRPNVYKRYKCRCFIYVTAVFNVFFTYISDTLWKIVQVNAIFFMTDGKSPENFPVQETARNLCKYDMYLSATSLEEELSTSDHYIAASNRLNKLIQRLRAPAATPEDTLLDAGEWSHFVSLTFPSIDKALPVLPALRIGADAFEIRVDLLDDISVPSLHRQIALLRDASPLPIVFTVRSIGQIGKFPSDPERIFELLREGLRAGAEWIDIEACWSSQLVDAFTTLAVNKYPLTSRLLGSSHVTTPQTREQVDKIFLDCDLSGRAHILKAVTGAANNDDCELIHTSGAASSSGKPYIGVCLGAAGARSRVLNRRFTPVTHALMAIAAPGQLTVDQLMDARVSEGLCVPKQYFLFGTPIQHSLSPAMHNGAFDALRLPHSYSLREEIAATDYITLIGEKTFGGASVTIPHKESIIPLIDEVRGAAISIGAVNTIVREDSTQENGQMITRLIGYNTDWLGIKRPLLKQLRRRGVAWENVETNRKRSIGLVIGAGGTAKAACYAVKDLGKYCCQCVRIARKWCRRYALSKYLVI